MFAEAARPGGAAAARPGAAHPAPTARRTRVRRARRRHPGGARGRGPSSSGHIAMVSFADLPGRVPTGDDRGGAGRDLLPALVDHPGVGFAARALGEFGPVVLGRDGVHRLRDRRGARRGPARRPTARTPPTLVAAGVDLPALPGRHDQQPLRPGHRRGLAVRAARRLARRAGRPAAARVPGAPAARSPRRARSSARRQLHRVLRGWLTDLGHPEPTRDGGRGRRPRPERLSSADADGDDRRGAAGRASASAAPARPGRWRRSRRCRAVADVQEEGRAGAGLPGRGCSR